ncbi:ferrichrome ABC transporter substrate-binding protein [Paenibacillus chitinolyticus]|uniref:ABC transporter substrate-binding protein n=1 Tax=Paenibacillus chitinolyticus TaxID=79263 RepID=UPI0026E4DF59|nr:ABC transporter substrate-binding protein [Paenibacillus chitinolyticus]GKS13555.1 ferrichrome ABC transporter substrate-binding protein [Paenibacillus chitinolyticus]
MRNPFGNLNKIVTVKVLVVICTALMLTACGGNPNAGTADGKAGDTSASAAPTGAAGGQERTFTDEFGHTVKVPASPKRVFAPYLEDSLTKLGVTPVAQWSAGGQGNSYLKEKLSQVPKLDFSSGAPSPEVVTELQPDLIILQTESYASNGVYEKYSKIAPTYVFKNASSDPAASLSKLGELLGKTEEAKQALQAHDKKVQEAKAKLQQAAPGKKAAVIRFASRGVSLMGGKYLAGAVIHDKLGFGMSKLVDGKNSAAISLEVLPDLDVDYIFMMNQYGQGTERMKEITESPFWKKIPAVQAGHAYEVNSEYWLGSGLIADEMMIDDVVKLIAK